MHAENNKLRLLIQRLTRHQFGRRSEQLPDEQLQRGLEDLEQTLAENQAEQDAAEPTGDQKPKPRSERPARNHGALPCPSARLEVIIDAAPSLRVALATHAAVTFAASYSMLALAMMKLASPHPSVPGP